MRIEKHSFLSDLEPEMTPELEIFDRVEYLDDYEGALMLYHCCLDEGLTEREAIEAVIEATYPEITPAINQS